jgi:hypothetical protein
LRFFGIQKIPSGNLAGPHSGLTYFKQQTVKIVKKILIEISAENLILQSKAGKHVKATRIKISFVMDDP